MASRYTSETNGPRPACVRGYHGARDALASVTAASRGYVAGAGLGGGRGAGVVRERRGGRSRVFVAIRDTTDDNGTCGCVDDWRIRCDRSAASGQNPNAPAQVKVIPEAP